MENYTLLKWDTCDTPSLAFALALGLAISLAVSGCGAEAGLDGTDGIDGIDGIDGTPGEAGDRGADGVSCTASALEGAALPVCGDTETFVAIDSIDSIGPEGTAGADGADGADGQDGAPGADGVDGQDAPRVIYSLHTSYPVSGCGQRDTDPDSVGELCPGFSRRHFRDPDFQDPTFNGVDMQNEYVSTMAGFQIPDGQEVIQVRLCNQVSSASSMAGFQGCMGDALSQFSPCDPSVEVPTVDGNQTFEPGCFDVGFTVQEIQLNEWETARAILFDTPARFETEIVHTFRGGPSQEYADYLTLTGQEGTDPCGYYGEPNPDGSWWGCGGSVGFRYHYEDIQILTQIDLDNLPVPSFEQADAGDPQ